MFSSAKAANVPGSSPRAAAATSSTCVRVRVLTSGRGGCLHASRYLSPNRGRAAMSCERRDTRGGHIQPCNRGGSYEIISVTPKGLKRAARATYSGVVKKTRWECRPPRVGQQPQKPICYQTLVCKSPRLHLPAFRRPPMRADDATARTKCGLLSLQK